MPVLNQILKSAARYLASNQIVDANASARFLLADILQIGPKQLYLKLDQPLTKAQAKQYQAMLDRRSHHEPVAYITGQVNFCGLNLKIDNNALIPRPETEQLVQLVLDHIKTLPASQPLTIVDVGTGSGAIALALTHALQARPQTGIFGADRSKTAIHLAEHNKRLLNFGKILTFIEADLLKPVDKTFSWPAIDIIVANLPYIPSRRMEQLESDVKDFEPHLALDGGLDGLNYYRKLAEQIDQYHIENAALFFEIDETQDQTAKAIFQKILPNTNIKVLKDLAGLDRYLTSIKKSIH